MPCQRFFVLSDSGVPRTFVDDCICVTRRDYGMFSGKVRKRPCVFFFICDGTAFGSTKKCFRVLNTSRFMKACQGAVCCCLSFQRGSIKVLTEKGIVLCKFSFLPVP